MPATEPSPPDPSHPRLVPDRPFPPYRYVPGLNHHPLRHPDGHLRDVDEPAPPWPAPDAWPACAHHRRAIDLFNFAYWWEAHEVWEGLWHAGPRDAPERRAVRGLIQAAACLLKRHLGHDEAAARLLEKAGLHLPEAPLLGLDLPSFRAALSRHVLDVDAPFPFLQL